jgi:hypothetical protein
LEKWEANLRAIVDGKSPRAKVITAKFGRASTARK